jgi:hypothetical protein
MEMRNKVRVGAVLSLLASLLVAGTALAARPLAVDIVVDEYHFDSTPEPFAATGPAVDAGLLCANGTVSDVSSSVSGAGPYTSIRALKRLSCPGGTIDIQLTVRLDNSTHVTTASWRIAGGTGDFAGLQGRGSLTGTPIVPGESITDHYVGTLN